MSEKFNAIVPKLLPLIRMLSAPTDGEKLNAIRMMLRLLASNQLDVHAFADQVEHNGAQLTAEEMQKLYDKGFEDGHSSGVELGKRSVVLAGAMPMGGIAAPVDVGDGVNGYGWQDIARYCASNTQRIASAWEREFVQSVAERLNHDSAPTPKMASILRRIFLNRFAGRIE